MMDENDGVRVLLRIGTAVSPAGRRRSIRRVIGGRAVGGGNVGVAADAADHERSRWRPPYTADAELLADFADANPAAVVYGWRPGAYIDIER